MAYAVRTLLALTVALPLLPSCSAPPSSTPTPSTSTPSTSAPSPTAGPSVSAAQQTTDRFVRSLLDHDRDAVDALLSDVDPGFAPTVTMLFDNLDQLDPTHVGLTLTGQRVDLGADRRGTLGDDAVALRARVAWQVPGDDAAADQLVTLTFVPGSDGPLIAGTTDGPAERQPLWWFTPVHSAREGQVTVIAGAGVDIDAWLTRAVRAAEAVAEERDGTPTLVLIVPGNATALERVLGRSLDEQIAALTFTDGSDAATAPCRVVLNPKPVAELGAAALDFLLAHEAVHAATLSPRSRAPIWVVEGYADLIAAQAYPDAQDKAATDLLAQVRRTGPPAALPDDTAFTAEAADLSRSYAEAWFAFRYLVDTHSMATATSFYDRLDAEFHGDLDRAMPAILEQTPEEFTSGWRAYLERQAR